MQLLYRRVHALDGTRCPCAAQGVDRGAPPAIYAHKKFGALPRAAPVSTLAAAVLLILQVTTFSENICALKHPQVVCMLLSCICNSLNQRSKRYAAGMRALLDLRFGGDSKYLVMGFSASLHR